MRRGVRTDLSSQLDGLLLSFEGDEAVALGDSGAICDDFRRFHLAELAEQLEQVLLRCVARYSADKHSVNKYVRE